MLKFETLLRYFVSVVMRSVLRLSHVARRSFCKTCIGRYNIQVFSPLCPATNSNARYLAEGNIPRGTCRARRAASGRGVREREERERKREQEALALRRDLFQRVSHTLGHVRRGRLRPLNDISSRRRCLDISAGYTRTRGMTRYVLEREIRVVPGKMAGEGLI